MVKESKMQGNMEINKKDGFVLISVSPKIYPLDVVLSSAYIFTENNYILVDGDPEEELIVEIRPKDKKVDLDVLGKEFNNELINYASYAVQVIKNDQFRTAMINRVLLTNSNKGDECFGETNNEFDDEIEPWEEEDEDEKPWEEEEEEDKPWFDDPEGIAVPWEEKYGDKSKEK